MLSARFTDVFARCIWVFNGLTISCLLHCIQSRSVGVDIANCSCETLTCCSLLTMELSDHKAVRFVRENLSDLRENMTIGSQLKNNKSMYCISSYTATIHINPLVIVPTSPLKEYSSLQENPYIVRYVHTVLIIHIYFAPQAVDNV